MRHAGWETRGYFGRASTVTRLSRGCVVSLVSFEHPVVVNVRELSGGGRDWRGRVRESAQQHHHLTALSQRSQCEVSSCEEGAVIVEDVLAFTQTAGLW